MDQNSQTELQFKSVRSQPDMSEVFNEGGITDDGLAVDPISGNEIPAGSMAEEVRDDIPAQLSGGEYVVPADVLRFYGVKFFEELRDEAKMGLNQMEDEGRIGGEPVGMEGDEQPLSMEEEAELNAIMGMAMGGLTGEPYSTNMASAPNPTNPEMPMYDPMANTAMQNNTAGYAEGGEVPANTQVNFPDFSNYKAGFSFMGDQAAAAAQTPGISASKNVTLYGPNGEVVLLILPQDQARYDELLAQGYSTNPTTGTTTGNPITDKLNQSGSESDSRTHYAQRDLRDTLDEQSSFRGFTTDELGRVESDPIGYANTMLSQGSAIPKGIANFAGLAAGPVGGAVFGLARAGSQLDNIAQARASRNIAEAQGLDVTALDRDIAAALEDLPVGSRMLESLGFATGKRYTAAMAEGIANPVTIGPKKQEANNLLRNLTGSAAAYAESQQRSGYTGTSVGNIAVGNISGEDGVAGVVANEQGLASRYNSTTGEVVHSIGSGSKTIFRDDTGKAYVKSGTLGTSREYVPQLNMDIKTGGGSSSSSSSKSPSTATTSSQFGGYTGLKDMLDGGKAGQDAAGNANTGGCFLTTAVVDYRGEPDNGVTLTTLRTFRDTYLSNKDGEVRRYYDIAPKIVAAIPRDHKAWDWIGKRVDKSVEYINEGKKYLAYRTYKRMVEKLERDWLMEK